MSEIGRIRFDTFELDRKEFELRRDGTAIHVEPLVFDLLWYLTNRAGHVVSRDELIANIWQGRFVSDATVASCLKAARKALGDSGGAQRYIKTIRGRGVRFEATIDVATKSAERKKQTPTAKPRPSLAILPFDVSGDDGELAGIAEAVTDNLSTILTRIPLLPITSRQSAAALKRAQLSAPEIGRQLGVRYLLEGGLAHGGQTFRANVQLVDTASGFHIWAQPFELPIEACSAEKLLEMILARLEPRLVQAIFNDLRRAEGELSAGQLLLKATGLLSVKGWHKHTFEEAADLLAQAIERDPDMALAHAHRALILGLGSRFGILDPEDRFEEAAIAAAEDALELDNLDSNVTGLAACAIADAGQPARAVPLLKHAIDLNPQNGQAWTALGSAHAMLGKFDDAIRALQQGITVSPMDSRLAVWRGVLAIAYLQSGNLDAALRAAEAGCQSDAKIYVPRVILSAVHLARRNRKNAKEAMQQAYQVKPDLSTNEISGLVGAKLGAILKRLYSA